MGDERVRQSGERSERATHDAPAHDAKAPERPALSAHGALPDGIGNRALLRLLRPGQPQREAGAHAPSDTADRVLRSPGQSLDAPTRTQFERRFGHDFSQVRVHTGPEAAASARAINAAAYTVGRDVVFSEGRYVPHSRQGSALLAHELAHVVQQGRGGASPPPLHGGMLERDADAAASAFVAGLEPIRVAGASAPGLARQPLPGSLVPTGEKPQSLTGSLRKDEQSLGNAALEHEITLIQQWLEADPFTPESDHLRSELEGLQLEQLMRKGRAAKTKEKTPVKAASPSPPRPKTYEDYLFQKIAEARECSVDEKGFIELLKRDEFLNRNGLYSFYLAHRFELDPVVAPVFKVPEPDDPAFWENKIPQDLKWPIKIADETKFLEHWDTKIIEGAGDQGDKHIEVENSSWKMTRPALRAYLVSMVGSLTPFEESLARGEVSNEFTPIVPGSKIVAYYVESGSSGDRHHDIYNRDGMVIKNWHSETPLVNEGIGPLVLALPGVGAASLAKSAVSLGRFGIAAGQELSEMLGLSAALQKGALLTKLAIGSAEAGAAFEAPVLAGIESRAPIALVERGSGVTIAQDAARATATTGADTAALQSVQSTSVSAALPAAPIASRPLADLATVTTGGAVASQVVNPAVTYQVQSEAVQRVQLIQRMEQIVRDSARIYDDALVRGDTTVLGEFLYPSEVNRALQGGGLAAARRGVFVEWRSRLEFARDPLIQPHVGAGGYLGRRYVVGRGFRRGFADFFGTPGGLLSSTAIDITTAGGLEAHLLRGYLEKGLILTY